MKKNKMKLELNQLQEHLEHLKSIDNFYKRDLTEWMIKDTKKQIRELKEKMKGRKNE
jgi:hypothetical protein